MNISVATPEAAEVVVCSGLTDDTTETPDDYVALFAPLAARGVPMICANPDIKVERGSTLVWCAGGLAARYAEMGGSVTYAGKPHLPIYARAFQHIDRLKNHHVPKDRILAIGDGVNTDIKGAAAAGLRALFISSGVHVVGPVTAEKVGDLFAKTTFCPVGAQTALSW